MVSTGHNDLFNESGPKGMLNYLQSRLEAGDLSSEEALAMLSAVHEVLGEGKADRNLYEAYSYFMGNLKASMPEVYEYVFAAWSRRGGKGASDEMYSDEDAGGVEGSDAESKESDVQTEKGFEEIKSNRAEVSEEENVEGEAESEEEDEGEEKMQTEESEEEEPDEEETEPEEAEEKEEEAEEPEQEKEESKSEGESEKSEETDLEGPEEKAEGEQDRPEAEEGAGEAEGEAAGTEPEGAEHGGEMEWPQVEEPEPEEPIEGEEGEAPAVD